MLMDGLRIRGADRNDVADLARVELHSALAGYAHIFPASMPKPTLPDLERKWRSFFDEDDQTVLIAEQMEEPVGLVFFGRSPDEAFADGKLRKLYVVPEQGGRGIGSLLHDRAVAGLRSAGCTTAHLWVLERNIVARGMYARRGWRLRAYSKSPWPGSGILEVCYTLELATRL